MIVTRNRLPSTSEVQHGFDIGRAQNAVAYAEAEKVMHAQNIKLCFAGYFSYDIQEAFQKRGILATFSFQLSPLINCHMDFTRIKF